MLKFIILRIVWCIWCLFLDFLSSRNGGFICGTFVSFSMRLCFVLRRREHSFSLIHCSQIVNITWILFPRRLNHVCSIVFFVLAVLSWTLVEYRKPRRLNHVCSIVFFCTGSFELDSCGISQTTFCKVFSCIY